MSNSRWKRAIAAWLDVNRGAAPPGISREESLQRAVELADRLRRGEQLEKAFVLDEAGKDVLYALVDLLEEPRFSLEERASLAGRAAVFLRRLAWPDDPLGEREELLRAFESHARVSSLAGGVYPLPETKVSAVADAALPAMSSAHLNDAATLRFVSGEMSSEERGEAAAHIESCRTCSASAAALTNLRI